jgi:hypothetical protein
VRVIWNAEKGVDVDAGDGVDSGGYIVMMWCFER